MGTTASWHLRWDFFMGFLVFGLLASFPLADACLAVTLGQVDDFQDGSTQHWGTPANTVTTNLADAGPAGIGDNALDVVMQARAVIFNQDQQWSGDWIAANFHTITMDVRSLDNNDLTLWLGISKGSPTGGGGGDTYVSSSSQPVPGDGQWHSISFPVTVADFTNFQGIEVEKALQDVTQFRILHNPNQSFLGDFGVAGFQLDNIAAVPEPGCLALLVTGCLLASQMGQRRIPENDFT